MNAKQLLTAAAAVLVLTACQQQTGQSPVPAPSHSPATPSIAKSSPSPPNTVALSAPCSSASPAAARANMPPPPGGYGLPGQVAGPWLQYLDVGDSGMRRQGILSLGGVAFLSSEQGTQAVNLFEQDQTLTLTWHSMTFPLSNSQWPICLASGYDGAIWFTEPSGIGRMTAGYELREAATSAPPASITAGPDSAMWFTEPSASSIGRLGPAGQATYFRVPAAPEGITAGADGALWFSEPSVGRIGRITTDGQITEFSAGVRPWGLAAAGAAVWFADTNGAIGRVGLAGDVSITPVSDPTGGHPGGVLAVSSDGSVWFVESPPDSAFPGTPGKLGRLDTGGSIHLFSLPDPDKYFIGLAIDSAGRPWATTQSGGVWEYRG